MQDHEKRRLFDTIAWTTSVMFCALLAVHEAHAGEHRGGGESPSRTAPAALQEGRGTAPGTAYARECSSCHVAYPPELLSAGQWQRVLAQLERHYGVDASVDPVQRVTLGTWLGQHAGREPPAGADSAAAPRITTSRWFIREHREVPAGTWRLQKVGSASRCEACHAGAEQGDFDEHAVRIPR
jgi:hypothetical protein